MEESAIGEFNAILRLDETKIASMSEGDNSIRIRKDTSSGTITKSLKAENTFMRKMLCLLK